MFRRFRSTRLSRNCLASKLGWNETNLKQPARFQFPDPLPPHRTQSCTRTSHRKCLGPMQNRFVARSYPQHAGRNNMHSLPCLPVTTARNHNRHQTSDIKHQRTRIRPDDALSGTSVLDQAVGSAGRVVSTEMGTEGAFGHVPPSLPVWGGRVSSYPSATHDMTCTCSVNKHLPT